MFKRINKRQKKLAKEEELGLDAEMKQILGLNDTDTDESFSSGSDSDKSDMGNESDNEGTSMVDELMDVDETLQLSRLGKRQRGQVARGSSSEEEDGGGLAYSENESLEEDEEMEQDEAPMSVSNALKNPIYDAPNATETQDIRACVICPGKLLKNEVMLKVHLQSKSHIRRMRHFTVEVQRLEVSLDGLQTDDPRDILDNLPQFDTSAPTEAGAMSKRAQRKSEWKAKRKEKLKKKKEGGVDATTAAPVKMGPGNAIKKKTDASNEDVHFPASDKLSKPKPAMKAKQPAEGRPKKKAKGDTPSTATETPVMRVLPMQTSPSGNTDKLHHAPPLDYRSTSFYFADDEGKQGSATIDNLKGSKTQETEKRGFDLLKSVGIKKDKPRKLLQKLPKAVAEKSKPTSKNKKK